MRLPVTRSISVRILTWLLSASALAFHPPPAATVSVQRTRPSLAERLGYSAQAKLLIVNGDDLGLSYAVNTASIDAIESGLMTSATIMVPCPWFPEIAAYAKANPSRDFGVHLTHTSEWEPYRWGPVSDRRDVPGLLTAEGYFASTTEAVHERATLTELETEARAQIRKALGAGIDVTHLDSHMGVLAVHWYNTVPPSTLDVSAVYKELAQEFALPVRMASQGCWPRGALRACARSSPGPASYSRTSCGPLTNSVRTRIARRTGCGRFASCGRVCRSCSSTRRSRRTT
jgi:predicted glycoside hydrolase/deacetylase ChbG (UPF0249 family)